MMVVRQDERDDRSKRLNLDGSTAVAHRYADRSGSSTVHRPIRPTTGGSRRHMEFCFTKDGFWEESLFQWSNDPTDPQCVTALLLWQHGNFSINPINGTLRMDPFWGDGFQSQWTGCDTTSSANSNNTLAPVASYNQVYLYDTPAVSIDMHFGVSSWKLEMAQITGELLNPMWKFLNPPSMLPTDVLHVRRYGLE
ncbi:hypothetical protein PHSY_002172 [Pseudozyma hubeiensis SY62]|uniref:Protein ROT1 n=1 Tax=Pseudozyma hubeiensis (strain SY62) TaxID=1305764 RepID=R9P0H2_PSEHS|nr:hypothetical protein PHSY_002172 [Pseudozyma hubeiensis SY62]GAC94599.1 hypothetical protein PHSY_002172 [Pseudozyma hubeiensis SY62]